MWESVEEFERVANRKKAAYILSNKCWFRLSCAMAALTVFLFIKALVSMFGAVRLDELQCVYDLAGYGRLETGLINLCFTGAEAVIMCFMTAGFFGVLSGAGKGRMDNVAKNIKYVKMSLIAALCLTVIMVVCSFMSVKTLDHYYGLAVKFYPNISNNSKTLFINTAILGSAIFIVEIVLMKLVSGIGRLANGENKRWHIKTLGISLNLILGFQIINSAWESLFDILDFDYKTVSEYPAKFAVIILSFLILLSAFAIVVFIFEASIEYMFLPDEDVFQDIFFEEYESRVFDNIPIGYGNIKGYELTFEIPHTEYPDFEESDGEKYG